MKFERNGLEGQKDKIIELMQNREFVNKISQIEDTSEFVKSFEEKGISMSEDDAELIFKEKEKNKGRFDSLSEEELLDVCGGSIKIKVKPSTKVVIKESTPAKPFTAVGGAAVGGILTLIGIVLTAVSAHKWRKYGADHEL